MFVTHVNGVPDRRPGHERTIRHYTSPDLVAWTYHGEPALSSSLVIDACVHPLPGGYRLWYKDEADDSLTWAEHAPDHIPSVTIPPGGTVTVRAAGSCTVVVIGSPAALTTTSRPEAGNAATSTRGSCAHHPVRSAPAAHRIAFSSRRAAVGPWRCPAR